MAMNSWQRFKASLNQVKKRPFAIAATLTSAVSVFRLISDTLSMPMASVLSAVVETYRDILVEPIQFFLALVQIRPPEPLIDILVLYCMFGGAALRIQSVVHSLERKHPWLSQHLGRRKLSIGQLGRSLVTFAQWPSSIVRRWRHPILIIPAGSHGPGRPTFTTYREHQRNVSGRGSASSRHDTYVADARVLFLVQLALIWAALASLIATNYVGLTLDRNALGVG